MKYFPTIFLFILTISAIGQIDTSKIKIKTKTYYEYTLKATNECNHTDSIYIDYVPAYSDIKEISYPYIKTADTSLNSFINDTIEKIVQVNELNRPSPKKDKDIEWLCLDDKPSEFYLDYKINSVSSKYISLTIATADYACCGANGAGHGQTPLTFDLSKRKLLILKDIIYSKYDSTVYNIIIKEMKQSNPNLFNEGGEINNPNLFHFASTLDFPFALKDDRLIIYWYIGWGCCYSYADINIYFDKYPDLFDKNFLTTVQKK